MRTACKAQSSGMSHTGILRLQAAPVQIAVRVSVRESVRVCVCVCGCPCASASMCILSSFCQLLMTVSFHFIDLLSTVTQLVLHLTVITHVSIHDNSVFIFILILSLFSNPVPHIVCPINLMDSSASEEYRRELSETRELVFSVNTSVCCMLLSLASKVPENMVRVQPVAMETFVPASGC